MFSLQLLAYKWYPNYYDLCPISSQPSLWIWNNSILSQVYWHLNLCIIAICGFKSTFLNRNNLCRVIIRNPLASKYTFSRPFLVPKSSVLYAKSVKCLKSSTQKAFLGSFKRAGFFKAWKKSGFFRVLIKRPDFLWHKKSLAF